MSAVNHHQAAGAFALVLGGGGARGLAHIGVLKVLEREGLVPGLIVGTSMGAIIGAMYAQHPDITLVEERVRNLLQSKAFRKIGLEAFSHEGAPNGFYTVESLYSHLKQGYGLLKTTWSTGIVEGPILLEFLCQLLDEGAIEECEIPFASVSCDLMTGEEVVSQSGPIRMAVAASSAIPGVVTPIVVDGRLLVDGAPTSIVPVLASRRIAPLPVVAVSVTRSVRGERPVMNAIDVVLRAGAISAMWLSERNLEYADVILRPHVDSHGWAEFRAQNEFTAQGEHAANEALADIQRIVNPPVTAGPDPSGANLRAV